MLTFENTETAFKSKSTTRLKKARFLYNMVRYPFMVKGGKHFLRFAFSLRLPVESIIRNTVYELFCGGESIEACAKTVDELGEFGVETILDYSVEAKQSEADFDAAAQATIDTILFASNESKYIPFSVFKPTGVGRFGLWEKVDAGKELSPSEQEEFERVKNRFRDIIDAAKKYDTPVLVDAEESWIQTAVDDLVLEFMREYNQDKVVVYNTLQMYRWDRLAYLEQLIGISEKEGFKLGLKLVRGAYMEKERARAEEMNYQSPIQPDKSSADRDYDLALELCIKKVNHVHLIAGTHNEASSRKLVELMQENNIEAKDPRVYFAQLLGMSDHISYNLAAEGLNVVKYVPFGPVRDVMPYLLRRAEENTSVGGQTGRELSLLQKELRRRKSR